jgi:hypothetical protein
MTEDIIENNVLIAKFIGFTPVYPNFKGCTSYRYSNKLYPFDQSLCVTEVNSTSVDGKRYVRNITQKIEREDFEFYFNLGWLMPVIAKIEDLNDSMFKVKIDYKTCIIYNAEGHVYFDITKESKVQAVWSAVVEFIKMWNKLEELFSDEVYRWYLKPDVYNGDNTI